MNKIFTEVENILKEANIEEYSQEAKIIILEISKQKLEDIILNNSINNVDKIIETALIRAKTRKPIQQILNCAYFKGKKYFINEHVLIPRDETEILVDCACELLKNKKEKLDILDIGIGSGIISCELAKELKNKDIEILGVDISLEALMVALKNIQKFDLIRKVLIRKSDLFSKIRDGEAFDLIISNPPYIPISQKENLQKEISFEPDSALFTSDKDGIEFYRKIIKDAPKYLKPNGCLAFELGINQSMLVEKLLKEDFKDIKIIKDLQGTDRVITAELK